ncbi:unnamed protein product [Urochloa humidicola]
MDEGSEAWSGVQAATPAVPGPRIVPVATAFQRILAELPSAPTSLMGELDAVLHHMSFFNNCFDDINVERPPSPIQATPAPLDGSFVELYQKARRLYAPEVIPATGEPVGMPANGSVALAPTTEQPQHDQTSDGTVRRAGPALQDTPAPLGPTLLDCLFVTLTSPLLNHEAPTQLLPNHDADLQNGVTPSGGAPTTQLLLNHDVDLQNDDAPSRDAPTPPAPALSPRRQRRRRVFDMSVEFLAMFQGPLPQYIVAALTAAFNLDDEGADELDEALAAVAGDAIEDLQDEAANIQVEAQAAAA